MDLNDLFYEVNQVGHVCDDPYDGNFTKEFSFLYSRLSKFMNYIDVKEREVLFVRNNELYCFSLLTESGYNLFLSKIQNKSEHLQKLISVEEEKIKLLDIEISKLTKQKNKLLSNKLELEALYS